MTAYTLPISELPKDLSHDDAVEAVYGRDIQWIVEKLSLKLSVLVECDKQLSLYLYRAVRARMRTAAAGKTPVRLRLLAGHDTGPQEGGGLQVQQTLMQRLLKQLHEAIFSGEEDQVLVLPHLDILTTTTRSGLSAETREAAALLYENPEAVLLAFKDPSFELPKVIENVFTARRSLLGIPRDRLRFIVTQTEARKFAQQEFNPFSLYKYVSGLNAVRCRQILSHFHDRLDFRPGSPETAEAILHEIRQMTVVGDVELPQVDLERQIGGYAHVKKQLREDILDLLKAKEQAQDAEAIRHIEDIVPKGIIFYGPPGTGKTFFAKAMATALDATIQIVSGPELKSKWVGESEENLRRVFAQARKSAPAIIVFDELDSFASSRGSFEGSGVEHSMVNQLLTEMDGFRREEMVFVVGTTNFSDALDPALLRPGRFELTIEIPYPNGEDRKAILGIYRDRFGLNLSEEMLEEVVRRTGGFVDERRGIRYSGDHLAAICRALKREELRKGSGRLEIGREELDTALGGKRRKPGPKLQEQEERTVAVHEAGHAVLAYVLPNCPTIEKVTIASDRDEALGYVMQEVRKNKYIITEAELRDDICVLLGGRTAERLLLGAVSIGAYNDLQRANEIAHMMVEELGMSTALGSRTFPKTDGHPILGGGERRQVSEATAQAIDAEIKLLLDAEQERATAVLAQHRAALERLRDVLLEKKTAGLEELKQAFAGELFPKA